MGESEAERKDDLQHLSDGNQNPAGEFVGALAVLFPSRQIPTTAVRRVWISWREAEASRDREERGVAGRVHDACDCRLVPP